MSEALTEVQDKETINNKDILNLKDTVGDIYPIKDQEYDEFKQYETTKEIIDLRVEIKPEEPKPSPINDKGDILLNDMTIEQLRNAVNNLMIINKDYENRARRIQAIWNDKKQVKLRYIQLRDRLK